jgi:uncharacterized protein YdcH (DUF465 family)
MEAQDEALIARLIPENQELRQLVENHRNFEKRLGELNKLLRLNIDEEQEKKNIQKEKLREKDRIEYILSQHRG